jgi:integrase
MKKRQYKFTKSFLDKLPPTPPESRSKETEYTDSGCTGLKLIVNKKGKKRFLFRYQFQGQKRGLMVGEFPSIDIDTARLIANEHRKTIALGDDPKQLRDEKRQDITFYDYAIEHYIPYASVHKLTVSGDLAILKKYLYPAWKQLPLTRITQHNIQIVLNGALVGLKPATVNRIRSCILRMFRLAMEWGFVEKHPGTYIKKLKENNIVQRFLSKDEIVRFIRACDEDEGGAGANALKFALLTGMRIGEICKSEWKDFTLEDGKASLFLPHTKAGLSRTVLINNAALTVLEEQSHLRQANNPYIFASKTNGKAITHPKKAFKRIKDRAEILEHLRIHDLRHSFASILINSGKATLYDVQHLLGHHSPQTTTRYAHIQSSRLRSVSEELGELVLQTTPRLIEKEITNE